MAREVALEGHAAIGRVSVCTLVHADHFASKARPLGYQHHIGEERLIQRLVPDLEPVRECRDEGAAVTATVDPSGPASGKGSELRAATIAALIAVVRKGARRARG